MIESTTFELAINLKTAKAARAYHSSNVACRSSGAALGIDWRVLAGLNGYKVVHMTAKDNVKTLPEYDEMLLKDRRPTSDRVKPVDRLLRCMSPEMAPGGRSRMSAMRSGFDGKPDLRLIWFEDLV